MNTWDDLRLAFRLYRDPRVSSILKWIVPIVATVYLFSPIDLIPDVLLGVGQVDDLGVLGIALYLSLRMIRRFAPSQVVAEHLSSMGVNRDAQAANGGSHTREDGPTYDATFRVSEAPSNRRRADHAYR